MSDFIYFPLMIYGVGALSWFYGFFMGWYRRRKNSYGVVADRVWHARMTLLAPVWPAFLMFVAGHYLAEWWRPSAVGELVADFALDVKGRSNDE